MLRTLGQPHAAKMEDSVEEFAEFLLEHHVPRHMVEVARDERLTHRAFQYMQESDISELFPSFGDQLLFRPIMKILKVSFQPAQS